MASTVRPPPLAATAPTASVTTRQGQVAERHDSRVAAAREPRQPLRSQGEPQPGGRGGVRGTAIEPHPGQQPRGPDGNDSETDRRRQRLPRGTDDWQLGHQQAHPERLERVRDASQRQPVGDRQPEPIDTVNPPLKLERNSKRLNLQRLAHG